MRNACLPANPKQHNVQKNLVWFQRTRPNSEKVLSQKNGRSDNALRTQVNVDINRRSMTDLADLERTKADSYRMLT